jgi:hypothetical protein
MVGLLSLPFELIYEIFDHLQPMMEVHPVDEEEDFEANNIWDERKSYRTLGALARTCTVLRPIATCSLYKHHWFPHSRPICAVMRRLGEDAAIGQAIRHIRVLPDRRGYKGRSAEEIWLDLLRNPVLDRADVPKIMKRDWAQLEIALAVTQAPNLESLTMQCRQGANFTPNDQVPIWLLPIVEGGRAWRIKPKAQGMYGRLQTLRVRLPTSCSSDLAYLFCLPRLRRLQLDGLSLEHWENAKPLPWPIPVATSDLRQLKLNFVEAPAYMIAHMVRSCKALTEFRCERIGRSTWDGVHVPIQTANESRAWCHEVLLAIEEHSASLKFLELEPHDTFLCHDEQYHYAPLDSFRKLYALAILSVPFMLLMGRPSLTALANCTQTLYPRMCDVLPTKLRRLFLNMSPWTAPGTDDDTILDLMPVVHKDDFRVNLSLQYVNIAYDYMKWDAPLPLHFWTIKSFFRKYHVHFDYLIREDYNFDYDYDDSSTSDERQIDIVARELARHGTKGIEVARHFDSRAIELMTKVRVLLGFTRLPVHS